jgi:hypothetical protein
LTDAEVWAYVTRTLTSGGGGGATAQEIWEYVTRTLTSYPSSGGGGGGGYFPVPRNFEKLKISKDGAVDLTAEALYRIWTADKRSLTSFGDLVVAIWEFSKRTLTEIDLGSIDGILEKSIGSIDGILEGALSSVRQKLEALPFGKDGNLIMSSDSELPPVVTGSFGDDAKKDLAIAVATVDVEKIIWGILATMQDRQVKLMKVMKELQAPEEQLKGITEGIDYLEAMLKSIRGRMK